MENLLKNELHLEKKKRKRLSKNWKLYLSTLGVIAIGAGSGVGIYYGVQTNNNPTISANQDLVKAINKENYLKTIAIETTIEQLKNDITPNFIKDQLSENIKNQFNDQLFKLNQLTHADGSKLTNDQLMNVKAIDAVINYNYGEITNQKTKLTINVIVTDQQIVDLINDKTYEINNQSGVTIAKIENQITAEFIGKKLTGAIGNAYNQQKLTINNIVIDGQKVKNSNLIIRKTVQATIEYHYGDIKNQKTKLKIVLINKEQEIVDAIKQITYSIIMPLNTSTDEIIKQITPNFIKKQLNPKLKEFFDDNLFKFNQITINDHKLENNDLKKIGVRTSKINYNYGEITNQTTSLKIYVYTTDHQFVAAIKKASYTIKATIGTKATEIKDQITAEFINKELTGEIASSFVAKDFKFIKIKINGQELQDRDLINVSTIAAEIEYQYGTIISKINNLTIKVTSL
ncbi:MAG: hypothetical protein REH79_00175 [Spiroplasma sp.]|nr:hypothetical protein [Spiroplasma sp.]